MVALISVPPYSGRKIEPARDAPFYADMVVRRLPGITLAASNTSSARFSRTPTNVAGDKGHIDLFVNSTGGIAMQAGRQTELRGGDAYLMDAAEAGAFVSLPAVRTRCLHIRVPRDDLAPATVGLDDIMLRPIPAGTDALRYMLNYARIALNDRALTNFNLACTAAAHLRDLLTVVLGATPGCRFRRRAPGFARGTPGGDQAIYRRQPRSAGALRGSGGGAARHMFPFGAADV